MVNYPTTLDDDTSLPLAANLRTTTLNGAIDNAVTSITVTDTTGFPSAGHLRIEEPTSASVEIVKYTGKTGTTFTGLTRGVDALYPATSHATAVTVTYAVVAENHNALQAAIKAMQARTGGVAATQIQTSGSAKTANYTATADDVVIRCSAAAGGFTITLPTAVGIQGKSYFIAKVDASSNVITIDAAGSELIGNQLTQKLNVDNQGILIYSDNAKWCVFRCGISDFNYDYTIATAQPATGVIVSQGPVLGSPSVATGVIALPGFIGIQPKATPTVQQIVGIGPQNLLSASGYGVGARGTKTTIKGFLKARSATKFAAAFEAFAVGVAFTTGTLANTVIASTTETTRDGIATIACIVDGSNNIQKYNCAISGDATYTDTGSDASLTNGIFFELTMNAATTAATDSAVLVTIVVTDSSGNNVSVYTAQAPASTAGTNGHACPFILINCDATVTGLVYKTELT